MHIFTKTLLAFSAIAASTSAHAAQMNMCDNDRCRVPGNPFNIIAVNGDFAAGDADRFEALISTTSHDKPIMVLLGNNHGGSLIDGLRIGVAIHTAGANTAAKNYCYSACALAWLGGVNQGILGKAQVGFHAAYSKDTHAVTAPGAAVMGVYFAQLGLSVDFAAWATAAGPDRVNVVTPEIAKQFHLATRFVD
jgi:hypothetical protein